MCCDEPQVKQLDSIFTLTYRSLDDLKSYGLEEVLVQTPYNILGRPENNHVRFLRELEFYALIFGWLSQKLGY